ncbi:hypothetical protein [Legionella sp. CNM-4043-24]|uniref:hypothetical protein n=1 Tax=Legionella sp. CNM-4043-24 TaxID=3421646 RepID=UPI00403AB939
MPNTDSDAPKQGSPSLPASMVNAGFATLMTHVIRVGLNAAKEQPNPVKTYEALIRSRGMAALFNGVLLNLGRGMLASGAPAYTKLCVQEYADAKTSVLAATLVCAFIACGLETPLMIKNFLARNNIPRTGPGQLLYFSPGLAAAYLSRDLIFATTVFAKDELTPFQKTMMYVFGTGFMATAHKTAATLATIKWMRAYGTVPDFRDGVAKTLRALAAGDTYTHPEFVVPYKNPGSMIKKMANLMHVACGPNIYAFRLAYMMTFSFAFTLAEKRITPFLSSSVFFKPPAKESRVIEIEDFQHKNR